MSHNSRAHSKYSASGAERWLNCPGSVALSEGLPDTSSPWAEEGTKAHEILELTMKAKPYGKVRFDKSIDQDMINGAEQATEFIYGRLSRYKDAELGIEKRVTLDFIDPEAFGTPDDYIAAEFDTLEVFDYKYGKKYVDPEKNLQLIYYALGIAHRFEYNFDRVKIWIIQPRLNGYQGPALWNTRMVKLMPYIDKFKRGVERTKKFPNKYVEGEWCFFCKAKKKCPIWNEQRQEKTKKMFADNPIED